MTAKELIDLLTALMQAGYSEAEIYLETLDPSREVYSSIWNITSIKIQSNNKIALVSERFED